MKKTRHTTEQIIEKLRQADVALGSFASPATINVSDPTIKKRVGAERQCPQLGLISFGNPISTPTLLVLFDLLRSKRRWVQWANQLLTSDPRPHEILLDAISSSMVRLRFVSVSACEALCLLFLFCMCKPTHDLGAPGDAKRTPGLISNVGR